MKKTGFKGIRSVSHDIINVPDIEDIHKYLIEKHGIV